MKLSGDRLPIGGVDLDRLRHLSGRAWRIESPFKCAVAVRGDFLRRLLQGSASAGCIRIGDFNGFVRAIRQHERHRNILVGGDRADLQIRIFKLKRLSALRSAVTEGGRIENQNGRSDDRGQFEQGNFHCSIAVIYDLRFQSSHGM